MSSDLGPNGISISRETLYEQVWSKPISNLAQQYGITGNGLKKICRRAGVPVPPRGHWAKLRAGKRVVRYRLPPAQEGTPPDVRTVRTPPKPAAPSPAPIAVELQQRLDRDKKAFGSPRVPERLARPHPLVAAWLREDRKRVVEARRRGWGKHMAIDATKAGKRRLRILSTLFKELERRHHKVRTTDSYLHQVHFEIDGENIEFQWRERERRRRIPLTPEELKDHWNIGSGRTWKQVKESTGELVLQARSAEFWEKREWSDAGDQAVEQRLAEIVDGLILLTAAIKAAREQRAEEQRRRWEAERQRMELERQRKIQANRWRHLCDVTDLWRQVRTVREYLDEFERRASETSSGLEPAIEQWLAWARSSADRVDPFSHDPAVIVGENSSVNEWNYRDAET